MSTLGVDAATSIEAEEKKSKPILNRVNEARRRSLEGGYLKVKPQKPTDDIIYDQPLFNFTNDGIGLGLDLNENEDFSTSTGT